MREKGEREVVFTDERSGEEQTTTAHRTWWEVPDAPHFTTAGLLGPLVPLMSAGLG